MSIEDHFRSADAYIRYTDNVVGSIDDPFIKQQYVGFVAITAVTAYELAIKEIFVGFAARKHKVFGTVVENIYDRLNGHINLKELSDRHIKRFGDKYERRFRKKLQGKEDLCLKRDGRSIKASYGNLLTWRHAFVHEGRMPSNGNYVEACTAYRDGKQVVVALSESMVR